MKDVVHVSDLYEKIEADYLAGGYLRYEIGQEFVWKPLNQFDKTEVVTVVALRRGGHAKLSNGWVVDAYGCNEGTKMSPGGRVKRK